MTVTLVIAIVGTVLLAWYLAARALVHRSPRAERNEQEG